MLDGNKVLIDKLTDHLWNRIITNKAFLRFEDIGEIILIGKGDQLYVPLSTPIQSFYIMEQLRKFHKKFALPLAIYMICEFCWNEGRYSEDS